MYSYINKRNLASIFNIIIDCQYVKTIVDMLPSK